MNTCNLALIAQILRGLETYYVFLQGINKLGNSMTNDPPEKVAAREIYNARLLTLETRIHHLGNLLITESVHE